MTLDKILLAEEATENPRIFLQRFNGQVIIDEIQYAPSLLREIKIRIDQERQLNGIWILTGSQHFQLMKGISESLVGRIRIINLHTLSSDEIWKADLYMVATEQIILAANCHTPDAVFNKVVIHFVPSNQVIP